MRWLTVALIVLSGCQADTAVSTSKAEAEQTAKNATTTYINTLMANVEKFASQSASAGEVTDAAMAESEPMFAEYRVAIQNFLLSKVSNQGRGMALNRAEALLAQSRERFRQAAIAKTLRLRAESAGSK